MQTDTFGADEFGTHPKIDTHPKRGRPYKAPEEKLHRIEGWLPVHLIEWIREMGGSRFFRTIVEEAYEHKE